MWNFCTNKVALITGATSGIGESCATLLAKHGAHVILAGRNEERGKALEEKLKKTDGDAVFVKTDVSSPDSVKQLISKTQQIYGSIDFVLNAAGIEGELVPLVEMDITMFDQVMDTNLKGIWLCLKYQLPAMNPNGSIVNISTNLTQMTVPTTGVYTASKLGVEALTRIAAIEWQKENIRINAISPGAVDTPMIHRIYPDKQKLSELSKTNPLNKIALPEDIAHTALWLFSPLSNHIHGEVIRIDGGGSL